jgi:DNA-binding response OmpR family regulator
LITKEAAAVRLILVEDDTSLAMAVAYHLKKADFKLTLFTDGAAGLEELQSQHYDLVLLDRMLPVMSGDEMLRRMRKAGMQTPVLMLTAMDGVADRVGGLDAGADDYLVKPFAMEEMLARVRALLRRKERWTPPDALKQDDLELNMERLKLTCRGQAASLSPREGSLMETLMTNPGQVLPRGVLMNRVWGDSFVEDGNLDIYVHFLRKHLRALKSGVRIETVRGVGYRLAVEKEGKPC